MATEVITGKDIEYRIIADKGIVVCKLYNCSSIAINRIEKYTKSFMRIYKYSINDIYIGVAKCAPEDTFDEEIGKKIALTKAKRKRAQAAYNAIKKYISDVQKDLSRLEQYGIHEVPVVEKF